MIVILIWVSLLLFVGYFIYIVCYDENGIKERE